MTAAAKPIEIHVDRLWPRDRMHRYRLYGRRDGELHVLCSTPDVGGIGQAIVQLHDDAKLTGETLGDLGQLGVLDVLGGPDGRGEWIVLPFTRKENPR